MTDDALPIAGDELEPLDWEDLGGGPPGRAFMSSLVELVARPGRFFRRMATSGGLHEPVTFVAIVLGAGILLAFLAALAYLGLAPSGAEAAAAGDRADYEMPARAAGLLLVMLPLVLAGATVLLALTGSLFHAGGRSFGARTWEGSVSIWTYSVGAALLPLVLAAAVVLVVSLAGCLLAMVWPGAQATAWTVARWTAAVAVLVGVLAGAVLLVLNLMVGCTRAFGLEPLMGVAAGAAGLVTVCASGAVVMLAANLRGPAMGLATAAAVTLVTTTLTVGGMIGSRRAGGDA